MTKVGILALAAGLGLLLGCNRRGSSSSRTVEDLPGKTYSLTGVVQQVSTEDHTVTIAHQPVSSYMPGMTMPFKVRNPQETNGLQAGDEVTFRLRVVDEQSWIEKITPRDGHPRPVPVAPATSAASSPPAGSPAESPEVPFSFTNEFGAKVNLGDFKGQAVALDFIFTRCPVPDYCPRLSKNFAEAAQKLGSQTNIGTNWHFLSVSFDPEFDTPEVLRAYAKRYLYDSNHWSFLTGSREQINNLTKLFSLDVKPDNGLFNHGFRTIVINPSNQVQQIYPFAGDFSDDLAKQMTKAMTNGK